MLISMDRGIPQVATSAVILPTAIVIGDAVVGEHASLWYGCVVRADEATIRVGEYTNLQDGVIVHADSGFPATIGDRVTVGHGAVIHGATIESDCLIGIRATILNGASIGAGSLVAAGSVVREGAQIPPGSMVAGVPAAVKRGVSDAERCLIQQSWREYVDRAARHVAALPQHIRAVQGNPA
mgnify:CR=1 FL=1